MQLVVSRTLPNGSVALVRPYHISMEGLDSLVICRNQDDYDALVKIIAVSAWKKNVIIIIYAVVSNHFHIAVLARTQAEAQSCAREVKRIYSMFLRSKYSLPNALDKADVQAIPLESNYHVRNALAYIPRNALDNKCNVKEYPWTGYRAMFCKDIPKGCVRVDSLTKRERQDFMKTNLKLDGVPWLLDKEYRLVPRSFCDWTYLEQVFEHDPSYWLRTVGGVNTAQMRELLIDGPREIKPDNELFKYADDIATHWFGA